MEAPGKVGVLFLKVHTNHRLEAIQKHISYIHAYIHIHMYAYVCMHIEKDIYIYMYMYT